MTATGWEPFTIPYKLGGKVVDRIPVEYRINDGSVEFRCRSGPSWRVDTVVPRNGGMTGFQMHASPGEINRQADKWARMINQRVRVKLVPWD